MPRYRCIFFDLDNTLLDFRANTKLAFQEIFARLELNDGSVDLEKFLAIFERHNDYFWSEYRHGRIKKDALRTERFVKVFRELGIDRPDLLQQFSELYLTIRPRKVILFDQARETLAYLRNRYAMYLLTNGFGDVQMEKLEASGLQPFFSKLFIAELVGFQKPDRRFFEYAVKSIHAHKKECLMIGDDPDADIAGARNAGIDQVFFNPYRKTIPFKPTHEIKAISELRLIL